MNGCYPRMLNYISRIPKNRNFALLIKGYSSSTNLESREPWKLVPSLRNRWSTIPSIYSSLSKLKLSALVLSTTLAGFELSPCAGDVKLLSWTLLGVALSSFSASSFNQWLEAPFDSQMSRTRTRPLPSHMITPFHAFHYGVVSAVCGVGILSLKVGLLAASLSGVNILLYASLYTPMKRFSIANTWVGAVVGAIPPMIGYIAGGGGGLSLSCLSIGAILYCWQFPHFNSLSWNLRHDYSRAGYCMASVLNPSLTVNSALRHSLALIPLCGMVALSGICNSWFTLTSLLVNIPIVYLSYRFRRDPSRRTARKLFFYSLLHLPLLLVLMVAHRTTS